MRVGELLRIEWRGLAPEPGVETLARQEAARLTAWFPDLRVSRVAIEAPGFRASSKQVCASIEVRGWQRQVILNRAHADASIALREAFDALFRKFERRARTDRRATRTRKKELRAA